jgi:5-hydroxyisourate hydrolase
MGNITTHVLDTARGLPAASVPLRLERQIAEGCWVPAGHGATDQDGRCRSLIAPGTVQKGTYRLTFDTAPYFKALGTDAFYPWATVVFEVKDPAQHFHVPLLLSPFGYSTYRGS